MKNKKKLILITLIVLIVIIALIICINVFRKDLANDKEEITKKAEIQMPVLGEDRLDGQTKAVELVKKYLKNINNLNEYAKNNNLRYVSLEKLSKDFKFDIKEYENLEYECIGETTTISFEEDYSDYTISIDCKKFYLDN